jgi:hypothetical protein
MHEKKICWEGKSKREKLQYKKIVIFYNKIKNI